MTYQDRLRGAFHDHNIRRVAIVDDGYDAPLPQRLPERDRLAFRGHLTDAVEDRDPTVAAACEEQGLGPLPEIPGKLDDPGYLRHLWQAYRAVGREAPLGALLHRLFATYEVDRRDKLQALESLERLVCAVGGAPPVPFDSQTRPEELIEYDLVFLDFYLDAPASPDPDRPLAAAADARERSLAFLRDLIAAAPKRVPLVMLISSEATADDIPEFRKHASILASAIQFLPKGQVEADAIQAEAVLLGLIVRRREVDALWELLDLWQNTVRAATEKLMDVVRELDLPDYSYLQTYRLTNERVPLAHYLVWLFNGYMSNLVERQLHDVAAARLVGSLALTGAVPGRVAPTEAISTLYSAITTSSVPMGLAGFAPKAWAGDIFVRSDVWHRIGSEASVVEPAFGQPMPEVFAVVTPACDLVPERSENLRTVTTIGGTLHPLEQATQPTTHFLVIRERRFHVAWNPKWPITVPVESLDGNSAFEGRYIWVGRLRELYHADLQHMLTKDVGRVGLPVVPPLPHWFALRVMAKVEGNFEEVLSLTAAQRGVWSFFNAKDKAERTLQLREDVAWSVRAWVRGRLATATDRSGVRLREKVETPEFIEALQLPFLLRRDACDLPVGVRVKRGTPHVTSETGAGCDHSLLCVFGEEADAPVPEGREPPAGPDGNAGSDANGASAQ